MFRRKLLTILLVYTHLFAGCVANQSQHGAVRVGPNLASAASDNNTATTPALPKLSVIIPVFDPGLTEKAENYKEAGIWPELRRSEANRFSVKLKRALEDTGAFGAVRVTPDETASGDLYVLGEIKQSNGREVGIALTVVDASGKEWMQKSFKHEVSEGFYKNYRKQGKDSYDPVFVEAAKSIVERLRKRSAEELHDLQYLADLRFGAYLDEDTFAEHLRIRNGRVSLISKPDDDDPAWKRTRAIRVREQLFIDGVQQNYLIFYQAMDDSYLKWQEASFSELKLRGKAKKKALLQALGGAVLFGLAVAAGATTAKKTNPNPVAVTSTLAGTLASAWMLSESFKSREEAILHRDALNELGESVNLEFASSVVEFEDQTVELTGDAQEQFTQWRTFLRKIIEQEQTPDVML